MTTSVTFPPLYVEYLSMFPTLNGTGVLFIPAYVDHGSTSGQTNGASRYVLSRWCSILDGPGGERIMDVVPRGTELELQLRWGAG
jgi:hypothetical protein